MSFVSGVSVAPEALTMAADALREIGDGLVAGGVAADRVTEAVVAPGGDEVLAACLCGQSADAHSITEADNATQIG